ncbi:polypyrimidine tract-binding protein 1-like, partial [Trifolium medium]|nr:polypyrimidine tract-binding protein 1-like [Trifolium medium]
MSVVLLSKVFSAFGFVHKIATFEKTAGFQALIQFTDADTAASARDALDGRSIPRQNYFWVTRLVKLGSQDTVEFHDHF